MKKFDVPFVSRSCLVFVLASGCVLVAPMAVPGRAAAADCGVQIANVVHNAKYANYGHGPRWEVVGPGGDTLHFTSALSYTNQFSANVTVSAEVVSAGLGFSVGKTESTEVGDSFTPPNDGRRWVLQAGTIDDTVTFDVLSGCGGARIGDGHATETGPVQVRHFQLPLGSYTPEGDGARPAPHL